MKSGLLIYGVQPVREALRAGFVEALWLARDAKEAPRGLVDLAEEVKVKASFETRERLKERAKSPQHQGVVARIHGSALDPVLPEKLLERAEEAGEAPVILLLDGLQDPQNLGAIFRSAYALGAHGLVLPSKRSVRPTAAAVKASAGAALHLPWVEVVNLKHALRFFHGAGLTSYAADLDGEDLGRSGVTAPCMLVIGAEGEGLRPSLAKQCHHRLCIPLHRPFDSLNVSVATSIMLYELGR